MIERLRGKICARTGSGVVIDVNGVGYGVEMPLSALCALPQNDQVIDVWVETHVREDAIRLFGFLTYEDRQTFGLIRTVTGVGPKTALALVSALPGRQLRLVVLQGRHEYLEKVPGVGKKLAERLILELRSKFEKEKPGATAMAALPVKTGKNGSPILDFDEFDSATELTIEEAKEQIFIDVRSALENFGYKEREVAPIMQRLRASVPVETSEAKFPDLLKAALRELRDA